MYSPLKVNRRFGVTYRLHIQGTRISETRNLREAGSKPLLSTCKQVFEVSLYDLYLTECNENIIYPHSNRSDTR
jgi:hypothetical protein